MVVAGFFGGAIPRSWYRFAPIVVVVGVTGGRKHKTRKTRSDLKRFSIIINYCTIQIIVKKKKQTATTTIIINDRRFRGRAEKKYRFSRTGEIVRRRRRQQPSASDVLLLSARLLHGSRLYYEWRARTTKNGSASLERVSRVRDRAGERRTGGFGGSHRRAVLPLGRAPHYSTASSANKSAFHRATRSFNNIIINKLLLLLL